jgi:hypothetical protein
VRGVTIAGEPVDRIANPAAASTPLGAAPSLVRTRGGEVGIRTKAVPGLDSSVSLFALDQASEIIFNGDGGDTSPSRPSERYGVEWTNRYRPLPWVDIDADLAMTYARFLGYDGAQEAVYLSLAGFPQAQIGNAPGDYIPNAPAAVASAGITSARKRAGSGRYCGSPCRHRRKIRSC